MERAKTTLGRFSISILFGSDVIASYSCSTTTYEYNDDGTYTVTNGNYTISCSRDTTYGEGNLCYLDDYILSIITEASGVEKEMKEMPDLQTISDRFMASFSIDNAIINSGDSTGGSSESGTDTGANASGSTRQLKRIYTVEEAERVSKPTGNTFRIRYK